MAKEWPNWLSWRQGEGEPWPLGKYVPTLWAGLMGSRLLALMLKEVRQILRNRQLLFLLVFPPTIQLLLYGFALNPEVKYLDLGVVDYAQTKTSRELVASLTHNQVFIRNPHSSSQAALGEQVRRGEIAAGVVIPPDWQRRLQRGQTAEIQVLIDGVNANTAGIANGYINQIVQVFSRNLEPPTAPVPIQPQVHFLYNPGLMSSWFFVPGMIGVVLTLTSSLVSSSALVREKDTGTLEQLLMTPASAGEILLAKIIPLFILLMGDVMLALLVATLVFSVPFRGSVLLFLSLSGLYIFVGIGVGMMLATIARNQQQVVLISFFINMPLIQLSGAIAPVESMPLLIRYLSWLNPLRHYITIVRSILLRGVGLDVLWPHVLALFVFVIFLLSISTHRFRQQLS
ncbi:ABC transporter permease [Trichothermofontia sp.]